MLSRDDCQRLIDDRDTTEDLTEIINSYVILLEQRDELFPKDFPLASFYAKMAAKAPDQGVAKAREADQFADGLLAKGDTEKAIEAYKSAVDSGLRDCGNIGPSR